MEKKHIKSTKKNTFTKIRAFPEMFTVNAQGRKKRVVKTMCEMPINRLTDFWTLQTDKWLGRARTCNVFLATREYPLNFSGSCFFSSSFSFENEKEKITINRKMSISYVSVQRAAYSILCAVWKRTPVQISQFVFSSEYTRISCKIFQFSNLRLPKSSREAAKRRLVSMKNDAYGTWNMVSKTNIVQYKLTIMLIAFCVVNGR